MIAQVNFQFVRAPLRDHGLRLDVAVTDTSSGSLNACLYESEAGHFKTAEHGILVVARVPSAERR